MANKIWTNVEVEKLAKEKFNGDIQKAEFWVIDHDDWLEDECPEEIKAKIKMATKGIKDTTKPKTERKPREKDKEKIEIIGSLSEFIKKNLDENAQITNEVKEIIFKIGENDYSISLIKHRKK